ncbi:MAG: DUF2272 domain-containing protein [Alphaproteobacteria bacterium]|nr:DUF2272 domain-containing protein [Alphaproteobacteria bacterium]
MSSGGPALRGLALLAAVLLAGCPAPPEEVLPPGPAPGVTTSLNAHVPPFARWPYQPFSREAAVQIALREWRAFGQQVVFPNTELPVDEERQEGMWQRVGEYWWLGLDPRWTSQAWTGIHNENGQVFPESQDGNYAWSAAFISYVMRMAGAGNGFPYTETHSDYINAARRHEMGEEPNIVLTTERMEVYAPQRGDLICYWRGRRPITYDDLPAGRFGGHCDIVVEIKPGELEVIGGNVDNAVAMKHIPATSDGHLAGPDGVVLDPDHNYFVVLKVDYAR